MKETLFEEFGVSNLSPAVTISKSSVAFNIYPCGEYPSFSETNGIFGVFVD